MLRIFFCLGAFLMGDMESDWQKKLPSQMNGWQRQEVKVFGPDNLFEYIDGGAELYVSYGFQNLLACKYLKQGQPDIAVDIFDMGNSYNAFGVFSHGRETNDKSIGQDSEYGGGLLTFWKGNFYVSILSFPENRDSRKTVLEMGRSIAAAIKQKGAYPPMLEFLPPGGLAAESVRYFRHYIWINSHYFISTENILLFDENTEAVLAKYRPGEGVYFVLLVSYSEEEKSGKAFTHFMKHYLPDADAGGIERIEDGKWSGAAQFGRYITAMFNAADRETITAVFKIIKDKINGRFAP
jgi:hypothetical protein